MANDKRAAEDAARDSGGGDEIQVGNITGSVAAIGAGAQVIYNNVQRALTSVEVGEQAEVLERKRLGNALNDYVKRLQNQAGQAAAGAADKRPYKALLEYDIDDAALFYGRTTAIKELSERLNAGALTVLHSESGSGKTSLLKAGIMSRLLAHGDVPLYVRPYQTPAHIAIKRALLPQLEQAPGLGVASLHDFLRGVTGLLGGQKLVVILDQFEEVFTVQGAEARVEFVAELAPCLEDNLLPVRWLIALRDEWFGQLGTFRPQIRQPYANEYLLKPLDHAEAAQVIAEPVKTRGVSYEDGLVERLVTDLGQDQVAPPQLQLVCSALYDSRDATGKITLAAYDALGGTGGILRSYLDTVLARDIPAEQRVAARRLLEALITSDRHRAIRTDDDLAAELAVLGIARVTVDQVLRLLVDSRLLRVDEIGEDKTQPAYELAHDYLVEKIELDPATRARKAAQELLAQEVHAYKEYKTLLSPDKLAIIEPQESALVVDDDARALLEASREKRDAEAHEKERQRQLRTRILIGATVVALILTAVAVFFGVQANQSAEEAGVERDHAQALALAAQSEAELQGAHPERGILLALFALEHGSYTPQAERALGRAEQQSRLKLILTGHTDNVLDAAWSPDGKRIATASAEGAVKVWDAATGKELVPLSGHKTVADSVAWSPDGKRLATASWDSSAIVWDAATGKALLTLAGYGYGPNRYNFTGVSWSPDATRLVTGSSDGTASVWNLATGKVALTLGHVVIAFGGEPDAVTSVAWSPDGTRIATGKGPDTTVWDAATGQSLLTLTGLKTVVSRLVWSPDGTRLATANGDSTAKVWDAATGEELLSLSADSYSVHSVAWSADGTRLATVGFDQATKVWNVADGRELFSLSGHTDTVNSVAWSPDGTRLVTTSSDKTAEVWALTSDQELMTLTGPKGALFTSVAWSPDGKHLASGSSDKTATVWDAASGQQSLSLSGHTDSVTSVAWSPDGTRIATASNDKTARVWNAATGKALVTVAGDRGAVTSMAWSPDGTQLATRSKDGSASVWELAAGEKLVYLSASLGDGIGMSWSPDGKRLAIATSTGTAQVWDPTAGDGLFYVAGSTSNATGVEAVAWSPDGTHIANANDDGMVYVSDAEKGRLTATLSGHTGSVLGLAWSPDGKRIATASKDKTVKVWDAITGQALLTFSGHTDWVTGVAWSPDGTRLASASNDGTLKVWRVFPDLKSLIDYTRQCCVFRELTPEERTEFGLPPQ